MSLGTLHQQKLLTTVKGAPEVKLSISRCFLFKVFLFFFLGGLLLIKLTSATSATTFLWNLVAEVFTVSSENLIHRWKLFFPSITISLR